MFRNNNPDKGTEIFITVFLNSLKFRLEIITPIRGRKFSSSDGLGSILSLFRNNNPDKGTEI